jgi:hypothetical protein
VAENNMKRLLGESTTFAALVAATLAFAVPATAAPDQPGCKGTVTGLLASNGYNPAKLGKASGESPSAINHEIADLCDSGIPVPLATAQVLRDSAVSAPAIASFLSGAFSLDALHTASALRLVGFDATQITGAMMGAFAPTPLEIGKVLQAIGYSPTEIATAMKDACGLPADATAAVLTSLGYTPALVTVVVKAVYGT